MKNILFPKLQETIKSFENWKPEGDRLAVVESTVDYIVDKVKSGKPVRLNFICTHNSRRSQFSQIWAQTAADHFEIPASCYSGGVEVTAFNERAVRAIQQDGFKVLKKGETNPVYFVLQGEDFAPIITFSKVYNEEINPQSGFAAIMTCDHADENCPFIPGAEARIPLRYEDPKAFDDSELEEKMYLERSHQIGAELFYVFGQVKNRI